MKIKVITVGKLKEKYLKDGIAEYSKRITKFSKIEMIEVPDEKAPDQLSDAQVEQVKNKEGERILSKIKDNEFLITLEIKGKMITSEELAKQISTWQVNGKSTLVFVIGGSNGLSKAVLDRSNYALSFSKMTFPHQLMKLVMLEQIYRAFKINNNESYHK
jgi:23S rRNA (pseudouridine1915-N3)-methyltransferase